MESKKAHAADSVVAFVGLMYSSTALVWIVRPPSTNNPLASDAVLQLIWLPLFAIAGIRLYVWRPNLPVPRVVIALAGLAVLSVFWSSSPEISLRRALALVGSILFARYLVAVLGVDGLLRAFLWIAGLCAAASLLLLLLSPVLALDPIHGTLRGVFYQKNILGRVVGAGLAVTVVGGLDDRVKKIFACLFLCTLVLSNSQTALLICVLAAAIGTLPTLFGRAISGPSIIGYALILVSVAMTIHRICGVNPGGAFEFLNRDVTLTGRTELWSSVVDHTRGRRWLGYGFGAFWLRGSRDVQAIWRETHFAARQAHNGYLDLFVQLGLLGGVLSITAAFSSVKGALRAAGVAASGVGSASSRQVVAILSYIVLYNFVESGLFEQTSLFTILFMAVSIAGLTTLSLNRNHAPVESALGVS